jgi:two-component system, sensor histidine kinase RegB
MTKEAINFSWLVKLRWGAIAGQIVTIVGAWQLLGLSLALTPLAAIIAVELASNVACSAIVARGARSGRAVRESWIGGVMVLDVVLLTAMLASTGGPFNPFSFLYLVEIALAALILRPRWTWTLVAVSLIGSGALFILPAGEFLAGMSHADHMLWHQRGMWVAFGVAATFIVYFLMRVRRDLEGRERDLAEAQRRAHQQERMASLATLAAGAAHELATPLGTIAVAARELERLLAKAGDEGAQEDVRLIRAQVDRCRAILDGMAADAGQTAGEQTRDLPLGELLSAAVEGLRPEPKIELRVDGLDGRRVCVPPRALAQAVKSLVKNAQDASPPGAVVELSAAVEKKAGNGAERACIEVRDRGAGMSPDVLARAGEPFFTTKPPGKGMGLGLFLTRTLVERLGGEFSLASTGEGTRARVSLPLSSGPDGR